MRALRVDGNHELRLTDSAPEPAVMAGEALIKVSRVLLTHADAAAAGLAPLPASAPPFVGSIGHLFVGVVKRMDLPSDASASQSARKSLVGKRVVASPSLSCAHCDLCRGGLSAHCRTRCVAGLFARDGACADLVALPIGSLVAVPDSVPDERAAFAHPIACAIHAAHMLRSDNKAFVTVLGDGLGALLAAQALARVNKSVRLLSNKRDRARLCERWGVRHRPVNEAGRRQDQDAVVDCTGTAAGLRLALQFVRPRGTILLQSPLGMFPHPPGRPLGEVAGEGDTLGGLDLSIASANEVQIVGCREGPIPDALTLMAESAIDTGMLAASKCRLEHAPAALQALRDPDHMPFVIELEGPRQ